MNPQANELLYKIVADPEQNAMAKSMAIASLAGGGMGRGGFGGGGEMATDAGILKSKLQVLNTLKQTLDPNDQQTQQTIKFTENNLTRMLNGEEPLNPMEMMRGPRGNGGGRRRGE